MTDERIIAYLLKEMPDEDLERFEDECFARETWPEEIELVEDELIEAYLRNELVADRRRLFETNYLITPARQQRVSMSSALLRYVDADYAVPTVPAAPSVPHAPASGLRAFFSRRSWAFGSALATTVLAVIAGALWLLRTPLPQQFAEIDLSPVSATRGGSSLTSTVHVPSDAAGLKVSLALPEDSAPESMYRVEILHDNEPPRSEQPARTDPRHVTLTIPASKLPPGQYALRLFETRSDGAEQRIPGNYFFNVE